LGGKFNGTFHDNGAIAIQPAITIGADAGIALKVCFVETKNDCKDLQ